ncbi:MAG: Unknown protein [uncultured Sulfurovum sp.]|uniref:TIGR02453 family protein n=1 Tax=uncultured Sulfurovum sp. TaxID=269237 RepID=A0A6S6UGW1_9BACT|nr:MAG: Unknown protein [uncultured Sulfurovum sp.]
MFQGFPKKGLDFLSQIVINNSKEWLDDNKDTYEKYIVNPNKLYVADMGEMLQILVPTIHANPKINKSLFRIYRDARFHRLDPIKERIGIIFWQGDTHRMQSSSFYMHYDPFEVFVATGIRNFKAPLLETYREYIKNDIRRAELHQIFETLKNKGYKIGEPKFKRFPRGFEDFEDKEHAYLAKYGSIFAYTTFTPDADFHSSNIIGKNFKIYKDMLDLHQWVYTLTLHAD